MMSDDQHYFQKLQAADPAAGSAPDLDALKARVMANRESNLVMLRPRRTSSRLLSAAAAVAVLALAGGFGGGFVSGRNSLQPQPQLQPPGFASTPRVPTPSANAVAGKAIIAQDGSAALGKGGGVGMGGGGFGGTIITPTAEVPNQSGTAMAYSFSDAGLDRAAFLRTLADLVGIPSSAAVGSEQGSPMIQDTRGQYSAFVGHDPQAWFNANNMERSPWRCNEQTTPEAASGSARAGTAMASPGDCSSSWRTPSDADALRQAKAAFAALGADVASANFFVTLNGSDKFVTMYPSVAGMQVQATWSAEISQQGLASISGYAAHIAALTSYPIAGARDVANRSLDKRWAAFGPNQLWYPQPDSAVAGGAPASPTVRLMNGKPMIPGWVHEVTVSHVERSLMQMWLPDGTGLLMPAWTYTDAEGVQWQMLAITADYVDWQAGGGGFGLD